LRWTHRADTSLSVLQRADLHLAFQGLNPQGSPPFRHSFLCPHEVLSISSSELFPLWKIAGSFFSRWFFPGFPYSLCEERVKGSPPIWLFFTFSRNIPPSATIVSPVSDKLTARRPPCNIQPLAATARPKFLFLVQEVPFLVTNEPQAFSFRRQLPCSRPAAGTQGDLTI